MSYLLLIMKFSVKTILLLGGLFVFMILVSAFLYIRISHVLKDSQVAVPSLGQVKLPEKIIRIGTVELIVEVARTNESRMSGLSNRPVLEQGKGMLFEFDQDDRYSFWMKEMKFPIDIIWLDSDFKVVYVVNKAEPDSYPNLFTPTTLARFVLEVPAGFVETNNISIGNKFEDVLRDVVSY